MKRLRNLLAGLGPALLLAAGLARAETVVWSDGFETNVPGRWSFSGPWKIGSPTTGPAINASGYRTHTGANCASTQNYGVNRDARLVCNRYNGASFAARACRRPVAAVAVLAVVQLWELARLRGNQHQQRQHVDPNFSDLCGLSPAAAFGRGHLMDLSAYAGQNVVIAFHFTTGGVAGNGLGWFVDDVAVVTGPPPC